MVFSGLFDDPKQQRARPKFTQKEKELHYKDQNGKCNGCGKKFDIRNLTVDHIKAFSKGRKRTGSQLAVTVWCLQLDKGKRHTIPIQEEARYARRDKEFDHGKDQSEAASEEGCSKEEGSNQKAERPVCRPLQLLVLNAGFGPTVYWLS